MRLPPGIAQNVRHRLYFELGEALELAHRLFVGQDPESVRALLGQALARIEEIRAALDAIGWVDRPARATAIKVPRSEALARAMQNKHLSSAPRES